MLKDQAPRGFQGIGYVGEINTSWWLKVLGLWLFFTRKERVYLISAASFTVTCCISPTPVGVDLLCRAPHSPVSAVEFLPCGDPPP